MTSGESNSHLTVVIFIFTKFKTLTAPHVLTYINISYVHTIKYINILYSLGEIV